MMKYTLVQHSGFGYAGKPGFERAVEERGLDTRSDVARVEKAGGMVFDSYLEASDAAESANYPPGHGGIYPVVRGSFSRTKIDGLRVYVPETIYEEATT